MHKYIRFIFLLGIASTVVVTSITLSPSLMKRLSSLFTKGQIDTPLAKNDNLKNYKEGELIIKFKTVSPDVKVEIKSLSGKSIEKESVDYNDIDESSRPPVLQNLDKKYKIDRIEKIFKSSQTPKADYERLKSKYSSDIANGKRHFNYDSFIKTNLSNVFTISFKDRDVKLDQIIFEIKDDPQIEYVELNKTANVFENIVNDPYFLDPTPPVSERNLPGDNGGWNPLKLDGSQLDYQWNLKIIGYPQALDYVEHNNIATIAVIDTGVDYNHPELQNKIWENQGELGLDPQGNDKKSNGMDDDGNGFIDDWHGWDALAYGYDCYNNICNYHKYADNDPIDDSVEPYFTLAQIKGRGGGHGTHVSGVIAAEVNNGVGIAGMNNEVRIMALRGLGADGGGYSSQLASLIDYATNNGAQVVNMSWGGPASQVVSDALTRAYDSGVVLVASAGNSSQNQIGFPASHPKVMAVSATNETDLMASYSNYGSKISVGAPGGDSGTRNNQRSVLSLRAKDTDIYCLSISSCKGGNVPHTDMVVGNDLNYYRASGTSMASPHVAGLASLIINKNPLLTNEQVKSIIEYSADDIGVHGKDDQFGYGRINVFKALKEYSLNPPPVAVILDPYDQEHLYHGSIEITGTVTSSNFKSFRMEFAPLDNVQNWSSNGITLNTAGQTGIDKGVLGTWNSENLEGKFYLKITAVDNENRERSDQIIVELINQSLKDGWPVISQSSGITAPISFDINMDGKQEVVINEYDKITVYQYNGSLTSGWPVTLNHTVCGGTYCYSRNKDISVGEVDPTFIGKEVVVNEIAGTYYNYYPKIKIIHSNGSSTTIDNRLAASGNLADVNGDGVDEILSIESSTENTSTRKWLLHVLNHTGQEINGFPVQFFEGYESPVNLASIKVVDLDNDNKEDVIIKMSASNQTQSNYLIAISGNTAQVLWTKNLRMGYQYLEYPNLAVGDIDGDKNKEVLFYDNDTDNFSHKLYIWKSNGDNYLATNPLDLNSIGLGSLKLADLNNDGNSEVLISAFDKSAIVDKTGDISTITYPNEITIKPGSNNTVIGNLNNNSYKDFFYENTMNMLLPAEYPQIYNLMLNMTEYNNGLVQIPGWPKSLIADVWAYGSSWEYQSPIISDFDNDGLNEIFLQYYLGRKNKGYLYMLKTNGQKGNMDWPQYLHDERHTGSSYLSLCNQLFLKIQMAYGSTCGDIKYDRIADLNKDKFVNILDFSLHASNRTELVCQQYLDDPKNPCITPTPMPTSTPISTPVATQKPSVDVTPPTIKIKSPLNNQVLPSKGYLTIDVTAIDESGISSIKLFFDNKLVKTCSSISTCTHSLAINKISRGTHSVMVEAYDKSTQANMTTSSVNVVKK